ncbi:MAG: hypothetical protein R3C68_03445 [Myxococcota bacterium]
MAAQADAESDPVQEAVLRGMVRTQNQLADRFVFTYLRDGLAAIAPNTAGLWSRHDKYLSQIQREWTAYYDAVRDRVATPSRPRGAVPYAFCTDERAFFTNVDCQPYDKGASFTELTRDRMERYDAYYPFRNFRRDRASFHDRGFAGGYLLGLYSRFFSPMSKVFSFTQFSTSEFAEDKDGVPILFSDFPVGRDWQGAGFEALNFLTQIIEQPEPGEYCLDSGDNLFLPVGPGDVCVSGEQMSVGLGVGKNFNTNWTDEYFYKVTRLGVFYDKLAALLALTDNSNSFFRDASQLFDIGAFSLSFWTADIQDELLDLFRSAYTGRSSQFAWRYDESLPEGDAFIPTPVVDIYNDAVATSLPRIQGSSSWTLRYWALILPMARFSNSFDFVPDFVHYGRICIAGNRDCFDIEQPDGSGGLIAPAEFTDPLTGYRYLASWTDRPNRAIGALLLDETQTFATDSYAPAKQAELDAKDAYDMSPSPSTEQAWRDATNELQRVERQLVERVDFINIIRNAASMVAGFD